MKANVSYNHDGELQRIKVSDATGDYLRAHMDGSTAVVTHFYPADGSESVELREAMSAVDYLESLPFIQAVTLGEGDE